MRLRTIGLISTLALGLLAAALPAEAQQAGKVYRIGYVCGCSRPLQAHHIAFWQRMRELGYVEGQNLVIEERNIKGTGRTKAQAAKLAAEMVRLKLDVIVTPPSSRVTREFQRATRTIPIVMPGIGDDPVKEGFAMSLARPGGNITGLTNLRAKLYPKRLQLLKQAFPRMPRVSILWSPVQRRRSIKEIEPVGQALGIQIQSLHVFRPGHLERAFSAILHADRAQPRESPRGLLVATSFVMIENKARMFEFAAERKLPAMYDRSTFVDAGGLMYYGTDLVELRRRTANYVDKILKGANPGDLPIERLTKFNFVINLKTAKQLGVTIPPEVLYQATKVIK